MIENILLILLIVLFVAKLMGALFEKLGLDSAVGELTTGLILGPSLLNWIHAESIEAFALIGSVLILFLAGMKQKDIDRVYSDRDAISLGLLLLIVVGIIMTAFFYYIPSYFSIQFTFFQALILGLAFAIVDVGLPAKILISKGLMGLPVAKVTIRSAIVNIIVGLLLFTIITLFVNVSAIAIATRIIGILLFIGLVFGLVHFFARISRFVTRLHIEEAEISLAFILILALAYITDLIGFSSVLGAFIAGVFISRTSFAETLSFSHKVKSISFGIFIPFFFVWFGLEINIFEIWNHIILAILIFLTYVISRFAITFSYMKRRGLKMPAMISSSMVSVDVESLVILIVALQLGIFTTDLPLNLFAPSVFFSTILIAVATSFFSRKIQRGDGMKGNVENSEINSENVEKIKRPLKKRRVVSKKKIIKKKIIQRKKK
jgi:Kef-type K+ transport system membrane component KefB